MDNSKLIDVLDTHFSYGMSVFQMDTFVVNDFITPYRKVKQAVVEIKSRLHTLKVENLNLREKKIQREVNAERPATTDIEKELKEITLARMDLTIEDIQSKIKQTEFEIDTFNASLAKEIEALGGIEVFTEKLNDRDYHIAQEKEYWIEKMAQSAMYDLVQTGTISKGVLGSIHSMEKEDRALCLEKAIKTQFQSIEELNKAKDQLLLEVD